MAHRIALSPRVPSLPAHRPADRVEQAGRRHRLACRHARRLCLLGLMPLSSKCFSRQPFKTFLDNFLKTFRVNLLETTKHIPLPIYPAPLFCGLRRSVSPPAVSSFSLVCDLSWLKRRVFRIASRLVSRLAPRPAMPSCLSSACVLIRRCLSLAHRHSPLLVPASRPSCRPSLTPRLPDTQGGKRNETVAETVAWLVRVI